MLGERLSEVDKLVTFAQLDKSDSHKFLAQHLYGVIEQALARVKPAASPKNDSGKQPGIIDRQIEICNEVLQLLDNHGINNMPGDVEKYKNFITQLLTQAFNNRV